MEDKTPTKKPVPGYSPEFGKRMQTIVDIIGSQLAASEIADVTNEQIRKWTYGRAKIPLTAAGKLCDAAGVTLDWLYSGKTIDAEQHLVALDDELLTDVVMNVNKSLKVDEYLKVAKFPMALESVAAAYVAAYRATMISRDKVLKGELEVVHPEEP